MSASTAADICARLSHWSVLAAGVLITSAATGNHSTIRLLRRPAVYEGKIADGSATVTVPSWFPVDFAILATEQGELYSRVREIALPQKLVSGQAEVQCTFDLREIAAGVRSKTFTLTYFPWFRFLAEPIAFEAEDSVADYVAECIRFLVAREGVPATVEPSHDSCVVHCGNEMSISVEGMESLERIVIDADGATSFIDLEEMSMQVDRRMFPEAFAMGHEMLATPDRLANMEAEETGDHFVLRTLTARG